ncbi:rod shape-determining protein MreC [Paenibacillaceae bacterium]|nr:rod shape-determining protein MreC [Paenibacillaceae bacterium]
MIGLFKLMGNKRLFILMIGLILFIAIMGFTLGNRKDLSWPEKFVKDTVSVVQQWFYKPAGYLAGLFEDITTLKAIYEENEVFRTTVARYARDKSNYNRVTAENEQLKKLLEFKQHQMEINDYSYVIAQVTSVSPDPYNQSIIINLGSKHGIRPDMAVTTADGLVGIVTKVTPVSATVMPLTALDNQSSSTKYISATVEGAEDDLFGVVESYNKETKQLLMTKITEEDSLRLKKDDTIITSGKGNVFPHGVAIGKVVSWQVGDFGLTYTATIEPAAQFDKLTEVFVIIVPSYEESEE